MKSLVYETPVNSAKELVARISAAGGEIRNTPEMLSNVRRSMKRRCEACITCDGRQQFSRFCAPEPLFPTIVTFRSVDGIGESFQPFIPPNAELSPNIAPARDAKCSTRLSNITITPG
ncbi:hypothetical protein TNCV_343771 [Trichonephila clavipes]|nr:hypothetical protein TNCV_343771 [Trichonephila clavipes]